MEPPAQNRLNSSPQRSLSSSATGRCPGLAPPRARWRHTDCSASRGKLRRPPPAPAFNLIHALVPSRPPRPPRATARRCRAHAQWRRAAPPSPSRTRSPPLLPLPPPPNSAPPCGRGARLSASGGGGAGAPGPRRRERQPLGRRQRSPVRGLRRRPSASFPLRVPLGTASGKPPLAAPAPFSSSPLACV